MVPEQEISQPAGVEDREDRSSAAPEAEWEATDQRRPEVLAGHEAAPPAVQITKQHGDQQSREAESLSLRVF